MNVSNDVNSNWTAGAASKVAPNLFVFAVVFCYLKYRWENRRKFELAARIPGPTVLPVIGNFHNFFKFVWRHKDVNSASNRFIAFFLDKFPGIFRFWVFDELTIVVSEPKYIGMLVNHPDCMEKSDLYKYLQIFVGNGLIAAPVNIWRKHRKLINPTFNQRILDSFVSSFSRASLVLLNVLEEKIGETNIDIYPLLTACNLDTVCDNVMGVQVNTQTTGRHFGKQLDKALEITFMRMFSIWYRQDAVFDLTKHAEELRRNVDEMNSFTKAVIAEKKKQFDQLKSGEVVADDNTKKNNLLELLLDMSSKGEHFTDKELLDEINTFIAAGSDTSAALLCFCLSAIGMFPEMQQKLYEEVVDVLGEDREVTSDDLPKLQYLERFVRETLRLFPTVPAIIRKTTAEIDLGDIVIPANSNVMIGLLWTHRDPRLWNNPLQFDPDNFLPEAVHKRPPLHYLPFSSGIRNCFGAKYAMISVKTILAMIVRKFAVKCDYRSIEEINFKINIFLRPEDGFKVSMKLRK